jgi:hypothetical protein
VCGAKQLKQPTTTMDIQAIIISTKAKTNESNKEHKILFTQFGVNEPTSGGERSPFHYQSFLILDYNEIYKSCKNLEFS